MNAVRPALEEADIEFGADGLPRSSRYGDLYHPGEGAYEQARHVFLAGNGLPARWQGRDDFTILETGFGLGSNFLATWAAWRDDPRRCRRLHFVSIEAHPPRAADLVRALAAEPRPQDAAALLSAWPQPRLGLHLLEFEGGALRLWLALGEVAHWMPRLRLSADACFLDGFSPARNPQMWTPRVFEALARLAAPQATAATWSAARVVRDGLERAGFRVERSPGLGSKRDMTRAVHVPRHRTGTTWPAPLLTARREALVIGAGLAGAAAAEALARAGWHCTVLDRHAQPAAEASGNPAGIFHAGSGHGEHRHAELLAQAARLAVPRYRALVQAGRATGATKGLVHGEQMDPAGGWIAPRELVAAWLDTPGVRRPAALNVVSLHFDGSRWHACDAQGQSVATGAIAVLAGGAGLPALLQAAGVPALEAEAVRGQLSWVERPGALACPLTGQGYALNLPDGRLVFGATAHRHDPEPGLRAADHEWNVQRLRALAGIELDAGMPWNGRVGWRCVSADRLPWVGAVPRACAPGESDQPRRLDRPLLVPRQPGLYVVGGLGSRGLTWAPLLGELLAAWVDGTPMPLPRELVDALDPAREVLRRARRAAAQNDSVSTPSGVPSRHT